MAPAQSAALLGWLREGSAEEQRARIETYFGTIGGQVVEIDTTDGLRVTFDRGVVIHLRASGNAPELRCYTEATTAAAAEDLTSGISTRPLLNGGGGDTDMTRTQSYNEARRNGVLELSLFAHLMRFSTFM